MTISFMIASLINFYGFSLDDILWKMDFNQMCLWTRQMVAVKEGVIPKRAISIDEIKSKFKWNEETKKWE